MKYLPNEKVACLFVGETHCDTRVVRDNKCAAYGLLLDSTLTNELQDPWTPPVPLLI